MEKNRSTAIMLYYIKEILNVEAYTVTCLFNTGEVKTVNLQAIIQKYSDINDGLVSQLRDPDYFKSVKLDSYGTLTWGNGVDFDPDNLYKMGALSFQP
ncbi:DUF2442 domain-containing protein [Dyadobacter sandarakinus]|uniref:DUF2442 domain-containing protein n=1 Tax=Dyadobacter sandarakinus TaxID=2747268 RepID=A0ABX7ICM1_9BACT|nr:DUF2442 domain-containing protein [Dyadobacter sandarakinus]QRR03207.1 DUF2442 domain-containing protein [Dyadobacter sandarakinus]